MKRFIVTNSENGLKFQVERETLGPLQPEWGITPLVIEEDITAERAQKLEQSKARAYLADTDWLIIREMDTGIACPPDIKAARQAAREAL